MQRFSARQSVFFDESHTAPNDLRRKYGLSYKGLPAFYYVDKSAHGEGTGCSALCAISLDAMLSITTTTTRVDRDFFMHTLEFEVLPKMSPFPLPRSVLIMDNAPQHDHIEVQNLCQRYGVVCMFLPPYSYDFNPIEPCFHEAKQYVRNHWGLADGDTEERLRAGLANVGLNGSLPNYYRHCGYEIVREDHEWILLEQA